MPTNYNISKQQIIAWSIFGLSGLLWGFREAYHADNSIFEKKWNVKDKSFFGSKAWERNYKNNQYINSDGVKNPHKFELGNSFRDVWHFSGITSKSLLAEATFILANVKDRELKYKAIDMLIGGIVSSFAGWSAYKYIR